jgi:preprotein translocase subunit SecE
MAAEVVATETRSLPTRVVSFYHDVMAEMRKVTWPDRPQVQSLSIGVIVLSLFVGAVIWLLDLILQGVLVRLPASLLGA